MSQTTDLANTIGTSGVEAETALFLKEKFIGFFEQAQEWKERAQAIEVTDASQITEMKQAREARLALRAVRIEADKMRKVLKEDSLRYGKAVQSVYNMIEGVCSPLEEHLEKQEKFLEIQEQKRKDELRREREVLLQGFEQYVPYGSDLGAMTDLDFHNLLEFVNFKRKEQEEQAKLEQERQRQDAIEQERIKAENEALRQKAMEQERELAKVKQEQERIANELREKELSERAELEKLNMDAIASSQATDNEKLLAYIDALFNVKTPEVKDENVVKILADVTVLLVKIRNHVEIKMLK